MNKLARYIIIIAIAAVICFLAWYFSDILTYILIAAVLSILGKPLVNFLDSVHFGKWRIPHSLSSFITLVVLMAILGTLFFFIGPIGSQIINKLSLLDVSQLSSNLAEPLKPVNQLIHQYVPGIDPGTTIESLFLQQVSNLLTTTDFSHLLNSFASTLVNFFIGIFVVCFITFFFIKEKDMFNNIVISLFPEKYENNASRALGSVNHLLVRYFIGISIEILLITTLNTLGLTFICGFNFQLALILAFISGVLNVIPYIGPLVGGLIGILIGLIEYYSGGSSSNFTLFILPIVLVYVSTHLVDVFIFQPFIYSNSVRAHPLEIFMVILIAGSIGGVVGMLVAIPAYTVIRVFAREFLYNFRVVQKLTSTLDKANDHVAS